MKHRFRLALAAVLLVAAAACDNPSGSDVGPAARLDVLAGDQQQDTVGQQLPQPLVVRVTDDKGRPVRDQLVSFRVVSGGGTVFAGAGLTNDDGEVRERWTLGTSAADSQRVEARAVDPETGAALVFGVFRATALPDAPAVLSAVPMTLAGAAGAALADSLAVKVTDRHGNPISGATVTWSVQTGGGGISPATSATNAAGIAKASWTLGGALGAQTARASAPGLTPVTFTATAGAGPPNDIRIQPRDLRFTSFGDFRPLRVESFDAFGNPTGEVPAELVSLDPGIVSVNRSVSPSLVNPVSNGTARIVATYGTAKDTVEVVVRQEVALLEARPDSAFLLVGESLTMAPLVRDLNRFAITDLPIAYGTSAPAVATVDANGRVQAQGVGTAAVTAAVGGMQDDARIEVYLPFSAQTVDAGTEVTCAVGAGGAAHCWGNDFNGSTGTGAAGVQRVPAPVAGGLSFVDVQAAGYFGGGSCGLTTSGAAYCWGPGPAIGNGSFGGSTTPAPVSGGHTFVKLSVGGQTACGLTSAGDVYCWGSGRYGALGNGDTIPSAVPVRVASSVPFMDVALGARHGCALAAADGQAYCWGNNSGAERGVPGGTCYGDTGPSCTATPEPADGGMQFVQIAASYDETCGLAAGGTVHCLRPGGPVAVPGGRVFAALSAGYYHYCGRTPDGEAWCWGRGGEGQTGILYETETPVRAAPSLTFTSLSAGQRQTCGVATDGGVYCWGGELYGEMGDGWIVHNGRVEPVRVRTR